MKRLEAELGQHQYDENRVNELEQLQRSLRPELNKLRDEIDRFEAKFPQLNFRYTPPSRQFDKSSIKGFKFKTNIFKTILITFLIFFRSCLQSV